MRAPDRTTVHAAFEASLVLKGLFAVAEIVPGLTWLEYRHLRGKG